MKTASGSRDENHDIFYSVSTYCIRKPWSFYLTRMSLHSCIQSADNRTADK